MKLVVGIDASTTCTGYSVIRIGKKEKLVDYGKIRPEEDLGYLEKCKVIVDGLDKVLSKHSNQIVAVAIEMPNSFRGGEITRMLCGLHGIIRYMIWLRYGIIPVEMNTKHIKLVISGNGEASKQEVVDAVNKRFKTKFIFTTSKAKANIGKSDDDIADAIGAAFTYIKDN